MPIESWWSVWLAMCLTLGAVGSPLVCSAADPPSAPSSALTMVVMDPLALPLSCPCVKGYAQRDYDQLGRYLEGQIGRPVKVAYSESLAAALKDKHPFKADWDAAAKAHMFKHIK